MKTPDEWMRDFETKIADAQAKATAVERGLASAQGSASSKDGAVSVTVAPNGSLTNVALTAEAMRKSHTQLATEIMGVARQAQRAAAVRVAETFEQAGGAGSETYRMITEYLPPAEQDEQVPERSRYGFEQERDVDEGSPVVSHREPPQRARPRPEEDDDPDFNDRSILRDR